MYFRDIFIYLHIYVIEYYPAIKKNDILPFVTAWMDLEDIAGGNVNWFSHCGKQHGGSSKN